MAVAGGAVFTLTAPVGLVWLRSAFPQMQDWGKWPAAVGLVFVALSFAKGRFCGWFGTKHLLTYPPTWLGGVIGFGLLAGAWSLVPDALNALCGLPWGLETSEVLPWLPTAWFHFTGLPLAFAVVAWGIAASLQPRLYRRQFGWCPPKKGIAQKETSAPGVQLPLLLSSEASIRGWLENDLEITHPLQDAFGHNEVALRIANRIGAVDGDQKGPTIALIGELGTGKTSILKLVCHHLAESDQLGKRVAIIPVTLWPFDSAEAASRGILNSLTRELGRHVNVARLSGLPDAYVSVVEKAGGMWASITSFMRAPNDPDQILRAYEVIASAVGVNIVLWVEDLERFAGSEGLVGEAAVDREAGRLSPIRALLHALDRLSHVSVVIASTSLHTRFDLDKIARFVEHVPRLKQSLIWQVIHSFKQHCLQFPDGTIDPASKRARAEMSDGSYSTPLGRMFEDRAGKFTNIRDAISSLCATPRKLKQALRVSLESWDHLKGEIDPDDVLAMSVLRVAEPNVFALVDRHVSELQHGTIGADLSGDEDSAFDKALEEVMGNAPERHACVQLLVDFVFPQRQSQPGIQYVPEKPQGLAVDRHVDYWRRYLSLPDLSSDQRDQPIIEAITRWNEKQNSKLLDYICDEERSAAVENFVRLFSSDSVLRLLRATIDARIPERPDLWPMDDEGRRRPPGFFPVWRMVLRCHPDEAQLLATVCGLLETATPENLTLGEHLTRYYTCQDHGARVPLSNASLARLRSTFRWLLLYFIDQGADRLVNATRGGPPYLLFHCCMDIDDVWRKTNGLLPFAEWPDFADLILDAVEIEPSVMVPQIVPFLVRERHERDMEGAILEQSLQYDSEIAARLFDLDRVRELLSRYRLEDEVFDEVFRAPYRRLVEELT
jgi:hypothetical protein